MNKERKVSLHLLGNTIYFAGNVYTYKTGLDAFITYSLIEDNVEKSLTDTSKANKENL